MNATSRSLNCSGRVALVAAALMALLALPSACRAGEPQGERSNILILLSDDHLYRALEFAGDPTVKTPNLDRLAADGVYFSHCFTTMPQCSPSRGAIFTGQDVWTNDVRLGADRFKPDAPLWPRLLADAGYCVFIVGKWHNADLPWDVGFMSGANLKIGGMSDHRRTPLIQWRQALSEKVPSKEFSSTAFANAFLDFLQSRNLAEPFCAYVSFTAPHDPWVPPPPFDAMYDPAAMPLPPNFMPQPPFRIPPGFAQLRDQQVLPFPRTEQDVRGGTANYYGMLSHLDREIGRILDALEDAGLAKSTLVVFAGDHGYSLASHGFVGKQCMYEEGIRLPLIVRFPQQPRGASQCDALTSLTDFFPTFCEAAGVKVPAEVEGRSLLPLYRGEAIPWRDVVYVSHHAPDKQGMSTQCIRTHRHKLIQHNLTGEEELFDLAADPFELNNLVGREEASAVHDELAGRLADWASSRALAALHHPAPANADE